METIWWKEDYIQGFRPRKRIKVPKIEEETGIWEHTKTIEEKGIIREINFGDYYMSSSTISASNIRSNAFLPYYTVE